MVFGPAAPEPWILASDAERAAGELTPDTCFLPHDDGSIGFFLRGHLEIPVREAEEPFRWSVWVALGEADMASQARHWEDPGRAEMAPMPAHLASRLPYPSPTTSLAVRVHTRAPGVVPRIEVVPGVDHPLAHEQRQGITMHRVAELNRDLLAG